MGSQIIVGLCKIEIDNSTNNCRREQKFTWLSFWPMSMGELEEKVSLIKERDYKGGTKTLSQKHKPQIHPKKKKKNSQTPKVHY